MKSSDVIADILNYLSDGKVHTLQEIADEVEVSRRTAQRHVASLKFRYPIENSFGSGNFKQGVYLDKAYIQNGKIRSRDELQLIEKALRLLQKLDANVDQKLIDALIREFALPTKMEDSKAL